MLLEATLVEPDPTVAGHMTGEQAARVAAQAGARRLLLTHLPPSTADNEENLRRARGVFDGEVELAETGAVYEV